MVEVVWNGKYDAAGKRTPAIKVQLPLQTIETINESSSERQRRLERFINGREENPEWRNRLIWGDKKYVLPSLLAEFAGKINLIYIDPPFDTGADFSYTANVPDDPEASEDASLSFVKTPSIIEQKAYRDTWGVSPEERQRGITQLDRYLKWMFETIVLLHDLLAENGSVFVHCDWRVNSYIRGLLDESFGNANFRNEIVWRRSTSHSDANRYGQVHDTIFWYAKGPGHSWRPQFRPYSEEYVNRYFRFKEPDGRRYWKEDASGEGPGPSRRFGDQMIAPPPGRHWRWTQDNVDQYWKEGRFVFTSSGRPEFKRYLDEQEGEPVSDVWDDVKRINMMADERLGYDTQKPEALLRRIITASSKEGDLVLDCFVGSGTTASVAEKLPQRRRWIACDLSRFAIQTTRKRLLSIEGVRPFVIQNLGKYERQAWLTAEFGNELETAWIFLHHESGGA